MKIFVQKITLFFLLLFAVFIIGIILPTTPRASKSLLFAQIAKNTLLKTTPAPRIIFIGGSNLSFGLNSQMIKDSIGLNPINTGIHVAIGLIYMLDNTLKYIKKGDRVVVSPEYEQYYENTAYGGEELLRTILDIAPLKLINLRKKQLINVSGFLFKYSFSKYKLTEYFYRTDPDDVYLVTSFNKYGDVFTHWRLNKVEFPSNTTVGENFNHSVVDELLIFKSKVEKIGAYLYVTFPGYEATSFENTRPAVMRVEAELKNKGFTLLGNAERYKIPDSLIFNRAYHLSKRGVDLRTRLLIEDLKKSNIYFKVNDKG